MRVKSFLTSGKFLAALLALTLVSIGIGGLLDQSAGEIVLWCIGLVGLFVFTMLVLSWGKGAYAESRSSRQRTGQELESVKNSIRGVESELTSELPKKFQNGLQESLSQELGNHTAKQQRFIAAELSRGEVAAASERMRILDELSVSLTRQEGSISELVSQSQNELRAEVQTTEQAIEQTKNNVIASIGRIGRRQSALEKQIQDLQQSVSAEIIEKMRNEFGAKLIETPELGVDQSIYNLDSIPPMKVIKPNTSGAIGRSAAMIQIEGDSTANLLRIRGIDSQAWRAKVAAITGEDLSETMRQNYDLERIVPNQALSIVNKEWDFVVVDEKSFVSGPWAGALETHKLQTFVDLEKFISKAKQSGALIIVIKFETHLALTNTLRDMAEVLIGSDGRAISAQGTEVRLEICQIISESIENLRGQNV